MGLAFLDSRSERNVRRMLVYDKEKRPILQAPSHHRPNRVAPCRRSPSRVSLPPARRSLGSGREEGRRVGGLQVEIGVDDGDIEVDADVDDAALVRAGGEQWRLTLLGLENKIRFFTQVAGRGAAARLGGDGGVCCGV